MFLTYFDSDTLSNFQKSSNWLQHFCENNADIY